MFFCCFKNNFAKKNGRVFILKPTEMMMLIFPLWSTRQDPTEPSCHFDYPLAMHFFGVLILWSKRSLGQEGKFLGSRNRQFRRTPD